MLIKQTKYNAMNMIWIVRKPDQIKTLN